MRKVTKQSKEAFLSRTIKTFSNTSIVRMGTNFVMQLHGHSIATLKESGELLISNCGWQTNTTKERLNGLPNVSISQRSGTWFLNDKKWDGSEISVGTI